jgi:ATP-dependent HslUV protease ATP-binding subunit HslU
VSVSDVTPVNFSPTDTNTIENLTPREIVVELDRYIVGQANAKRAVAIALRNRYRRAHLPEEMREEVIPKNILMIGPTGVGKTEIARRLAKLARAPFLKIEATKFTEVGYVGRDVDSMVRDLVQISVRLVEGEMTEAVQERAASVAVDRVVEILQPRRSKPVQVAADAAKSAQEQWAEMQKQMSQLFGGANVTVVPGVPNPTPPSHESAEEKKPEKHDDEYERKKTEQEERIRLRLKEQIASGARDEEEIEIEVEEHSGGGTPIGILPLGGPGGGEGMGQDLSELFSQMMPKKRKKRRTTISDARKIFTAEAAQSLIDRDAVTREAVRRAEEGGIIFLDEIDKVAGRGGSGGSSPDVSREGVQRDLLPIIEGSTVQTKYGPVRTNHVLFIAAGAFHVSKPSDLIPELQGRLPIRVELESLNEDDFRRILTEPRSALTKQYAALLATEGLSITFTDDAVRELARIAVDVNTRTENIGARRLQTVMERLLDELSFDAPDTPDKSVTIDAAFVKQRLDDVAGDEDLSRYIL